MCQKESTVLAHVSRMELVRRGVLLNGNYARGKEFRQEIQVFFAAEKSTCCRFSNSGLKGWRKKKGKAICYLCDLE
jgi:hypothetical protein